MRTSNRIIFVVLGWRQNGTRQSELQSLFSLRSGEQQRNVLLRHSELAQHGLGVG
jgi:hypothetical protein